MHINDLKTVFQEKMDTFPEVALTGVCATGGLDAHHDGVNAAITDFWAAAEDTVWGNCDLSADDKKDIEEMCDQAGHLALNSDTSISEIVGNQRHEALVNTL